MGEILFDLISNVFINVRSQYWRFILIFQCSLKTHVEWNESCGERGRRSCL